MGIGQLQIFELEREDLTGTQAVQQHQAYHGKIAKSPKAGPELSDLLCRQGLDYAAGLPEAETESYGTMGATIAQWTARRPGALEMGVASGNLLPMMESVYAPNHRQAMIYGLWCGTWLLVQLITDIVPQRGFGDFRQGLRLTLEPASEVK
ncbi:MAG: hypothetical protein AAB403_19150 [Planctomycetota bacterium]